MVINRELSGNPRSKRGFTLIELIVVMLILAILAALIVPRVVGRSDDAKRAKAATDLSRLATQLQAFRVDCGRFPTAEEGLYALRTPPSDVQGWKGPYLEKGIPPDPWGFEYYYDYPGPDGDDTFILMSFGQDGAEGGEGNNADIVEGTEAAQE